MYVGQTSELTMRWRKHCWRLRNNRHHNAHLQSAWNKYGEQSFALSVIEWCEVDQLTDREAYWTRALRPEYCHATPGDAPWRGKKLSEEHKARIGAHVQSAETRAKRSASRTGQKHSVETRSKIAAANGRRTLSPESRAKIAASQRIRHERRRQEQSSPFKDSQ
jgi:group I intron endonuclease